MSNLTTYPELDQGTPEWLEARRGIVTASTVGQLITPSTVKPASNDKSRALVWELVAQRITGYIYPTFTNDDMARGHLAEIEARNWYSNEFAPVAEMGFIRRDAEWGSLGYSPDGLVGDEGLIEVKSPRHKAHLQTVISDAMPTTYMAQVQAGLLVTGRQWCDFISWPGGMAPYVTRIEPDEKWQATIRAVVEQFEATAAEWIAIYTERTQGLPVPPQIDTFSEPELTL